MTIQPRFKAYLQHTGLEPQEVKNHHYINWISDKWSEFEKLTGTKRPYKEHDHERFTKWLLQK